MAILESELRRYNHLNSVAEPRSAVFFGADYFAAFPFNELKQDFSTDMPVYNRSIPGLLIRDAEAYLPECVYSLNPAKIFVNLGEADLLAEGFELQHFLSSYEWLLYTLHSRCHGRIHVVSVVSHHPMTEDLNAALRRLANEAGCEFIDITAAAECEQHEIRIFHQLRSHLHSRGFNFTDAFLI